MTDPVSLSSDTLAGRLQSVLGEGFLVERRSLLALAHCRGILHRDIKPENILLDPDFSRDGRLVAFTARTRPASTRCTSSRWRAAGRSRCRARAGSSPASGPGTGRSTFFRQDTLFAAPVLREPLRVGARRVVLVGDYVAEPYHANWDISPDGRSFVFIRQAGGSRLADVTVVLNWFQNVARRGRP
jgi:hypothetical protein